MWSGDLRDSDALRVEGMVICDSQPFGVASFAAGGPAVGIMLGPTLSQGVHDMVCIERSASAPHMWAVVYQWQPFGCRWVARLVTVRGFEQGAREALQTEASSS